MLDCLLLAIVLCKLGKDTPLLGWTQFHAKAHGSGSQAWDGFQLPPASLGHTSLCRAQPAQGGATTWLRGQESWLRMVLSSYPVTHPLAIFI